VTAASRGSHTHTRWCRRQASRPCADTGAPNNGMCRCRRGAAEIPAGVSVTARGLTRGACGVLIVPLFFVNLHNIQFAIQNPFLRRCLCARTRPTRSENGAGSRHAHSKITRSCFSFVFFSGGSLGVRVRVTLTLTLTFLFRFSAWVLVCAHQADAVGKRSWQPPRALEKHALLFLFSFLSYLSPIIQLTPQQQSAEPRNSASAEVLAVARRPKEAAREKTRPPPVSRGSSP